MFLVLERNPHTQNRLLILFENLRIDDFALDFPITLYSRECIGKSTKYHEIWSRYYEKTTFCGRNRPGSMPNCPEVSRKRFNMLGMRLLHSRTGCGRSRGDLPVHFPESDT